MPSGFTPELRSRPAARAAVAARPSTSPGTARPPGIQAASHGGIHAALGALLLAGATLCAPGHLRAQEPAGTGSARTGTPGGAPLALTGLTVIDGTGAPARPGTTILIEDGRVAAVFADGARPLPAGAERLELAGRYAIPGLIDTHVHLATDPSGTDTWDVNARRLRNAILGGVTTVRDMAGDARVLAGLARAAELGEIASPDIHYSALFAGPDFFKDPRVLAAARGVPPGQAPWARAVTDRTNWPLAIAEAKGTGATGIKVYAAVAAAPLTPLVAEAHRQGLRVWSHATLFPARPSDCVDAGIDVLSHAALLVWEAARPIPDYTHRYHADYAHVSLADPAFDHLFHDMAARGTILEPTLYVQSLGRDSAGFLWAAAATRRAHELGVAIAAGTDTIGADQPGDLPNVHRELALLVERGGLTPMEALEAATSVAARVLGIQDRTGTLAPGRDADIVILARDPLADIRNTTSVVHVLKRGRIDW